MLGYRTRSHSSRGFILIELLVVIAIRTAMIAMTTSNRRVKRHAARPARTSSNNSGWRCTTTTARIRCSPPGGLGSTIWSQPTASSSADYNDSVARATWVPMILPYIDQAPLYKQFVAFMNGDNGYVHPIHWTGAETLIPAFMCPSDPGSSKNATYDGSGVLDQRSIGNYVVCQGSASSSTGLNLNGIFFQMSSIRMRDVTDGTSNTLLTSEIKIIQEKSTASPIDTSSDWRGFYYNNFGVTSWFSTEFPPNTPQSDAVRRCVNDANAPCVYTTSGSTRMFARSQHVGGVQVGLADGAVRFISENVNGATWGYLGSRADNQVIGTY